MIEAVSAAKPRPAAFYNATQKLGMAQNVTTFTESDFSRTFEPTTEDGSGHAFIVTLNHSPLITYAPLGSKSCV